MNELELTNIYVVICNGISDIGKAWLMASIGKIAPEITLPIKIDPLLNLSFPQQLGVDAEDLCTLTDIEAFLETNNVKTANLKLSEDFLTYASAGMPVFPECNIISGNLLLKFLMTQETEIRPGEVKKRTFNDVSSFLASEITSIVKKRNPKNLLIEVGGTVDDKENVYIPGAVRLLGDDQYLGVHPEIIFLTFFDYAEPHVEGAYRVKTQHIRRGITRVSSAYYGIPIKACVVRRRNVPNEIPDQVLIRDLKNVAYETQIPFEKLIYFPNIKKDQMGKLTKVLMESNLFDQLQDPVYVEF
ncbi:MAG: hypothetical protein MJB14_10115 [Spirochaetes bacterium]|nr:hypothetical protein [Spirochaetota bacterium]